MAQNTTPSELEAGGGVLQREGHFEPVRGGHGGGVRHSGGPAGQDGETETVAGVRVRPLRGQPAARGVSQRRPAGGDRVPRRPLRVHRVGAGP